VYFRDCRLLDKPGVRERPAALAAGNRVMLKPSELTPRTSDFLAELLAGLFPPEQVATIVGGPEVGHSFERLAPYFEKARSAGLHSAPHAGETAGLRPL